MNNTKIWQNIFSNTQSRFFTVRFVKQDGTVRVLNGKVGKEQAIDKNGHLVVFDIKERAFRKVNLNRIVGFQCGKTKIG